MQLTLNNISEKSCGVYIISNSIDDRLYIGSATKFRRRFLDHNEMLRKGKHHSKHLQAFVNKYGVDSLEFNLVYECSTRASAFELEQGLINKLKPRFNMTHKVFKHMEGIKVSEEAKAKKLNTTYSKFKNQNIDFVTQLIKLSQYVYDDNHFLAKQLNVNLSKIATFKSGKGKLVRRLVEEVEKSLGLLLVKSDYKAIQARSAHSKFITKYDSIENYKSELRKVFINIMNGVPKSKACLGTKISFNSFYSIINGVSYKEHSRELLDEFKEFI